MTMEPLDGTRLQAFVTVARAGGFSRAARLLGRTQSSVSEAVARLEEELGRTLLVRDARATKLTDEGRVLLEHAERILDQMRLARASLEDTGAAVEGELVIGTTDTLACYLLPRVFAALRKAHPGIQLRLDNRPSPAVAVEVAERRLEVGVVSLPLPEGLRSGGRAVVERLRIEIVARQEDVAICPPGHPLARERSVSPEQLVEHPLLLLDRSTSTRALLDQAFSAIGRAPAVVMETRSVDVLKRLVELGFGVSVVPAMAMERARGVASVPVRGMGPARTVGLITHVAGHLPRTARAFVAATRAELANGDALPFRSKK